MSRSDRRPGTLPFLPRPIQTIIAERDAPERTSIIRRWTSTMARSCRLCDECKAQHAPDGQAVCVVTINGTIEPELAPLFSTRPA